MSNDEKKSLCKGCRDDFYNQPGNAPGGCCYSLSTAQVVERTRVGWWQNPPYTWSPQKTLSCHHAPGQFAWIKENDPRIVAAVEAAVEAAQPKGE